MARKRAQDYEVKREGILLKAADLFARFGYSGTSISMIADACNVSKALLYHYYPDKEAVLFDVISAHLTQLLEVIEAAEASAPPQERLYALSAALLEAYRDADAHHQVQIANLKLLPPEKQDVLRMMERRLVDIFARAIEESVPSARGPHLKAITMSLFGMLNWHYMWFKEGRGLSRADYARLATNLLIAGSDTVLHDFDKK